MPKFARFEMFGGYTYAQMGPFNAGHWADLDGYNVSLGVNAVDWLALIVEGSEYFGTSKIPTTVQAPFPNCGNQGVSFCPPGPLFKVDTREYNVLFGAMFPYRKYERWVPFGELMYGHGGIEASRSPRASMKWKSVPAEHCWPEAELTTGSTSDLPFASKSITCRPLLFATLGKKKQDNLRLSVGIVIRTVRKKKRRLEDETETAPKRPIRQMIVIFSASRPSLRGSKIKNLRITRGSPAAKGTWPPESFSGVFTTDAANRSTAPLSPAIRPQNPSPSRSHP